MAGKAGYRSRLVGLIERAFERREIRYLFGLAMAASAIGLRMLLTPWTGRGAPFVLFFGAMLVTSLAAGVGPGLVVLLISLPVASVNFAVPAGVTPSQAAFQSLLYTVDGLIILKLTQLARQARRRLQSANRELSETAARLRRTEAQTRQIVDLAPDAYFQANLEARLVDVNEAACRLLGCERDELVGKSSLDIIPPGDAQRLAAVKTRLLRPGAVDTGEWTLLRKDGTAVTVESSSNVLPDGRWQAFVRDIGDRRRAAVDRLRTIERLRRSEEQFRLLFEEAPIGVALVALDGRFVRVNKALCDILGYTAEELERLSYQEITPPEDLQASLSIADRVNRGETARYQLEKRYIRKDGSAVMISVNGSIVSDADGRPLHYIAQIEDVTERKRAEDVVRRSELKFRRLVESMTDGVFIYQGDRVVYANRGFGALLGYDDERGLLGHSIQELLSPESLELVKARIRLVQETGSAPPQELRMVRRDGSPAVVETVGIEIEFEGAPAIAVVVRDLTERLRSEEALRLSEAKFSGIVSISADAIISIDEQQRINVFNTGAETIFGYSRDEVLGAPIDLLLPEALRERHRSDVEAFATGSVATRPMGERSTSITGRRKNGEVFPAEASIANLKVGDTKLLTVVLRDVTERERVEREQRILAEVGVALAATLDYERTLTNVARIAARDFADWCMVEVVEGGDGLRRLKVACANPAKAALANELEHFLLDRELPYIMKPVVEARETLLVRCMTAEHLQAAAQSPEHWRMLRAVEPTSVLSVPLLLRDQLLGTLTFVSSTASRLFGPADERLARAVAERAALAIESARLYRAALQATGMRDQVLGVVAHDLRNPLSSISLHAAALQRTQAQPERRNQRHKDAIERASQRMNRLIQDLLDVAMLEQAGRLTVEKVPLSPSELIGEVVDTQRALADASSIDLRVQVASDVPPILGDRDRLLQVFENLIGNALKFTEAGGQVTVGAARGKSGALFWVADTGRGMTRDDLTRVFDRFWQASARSGRLGAGLGLPITKGIVESHGGRIWVESAPGHGSTFYFSVPPEPGVAARAADVLH